MSFSPAERKVLAQKGLAMPDGGYPIRNRKDLANAISAYGRGANKPAVKAWIKKRAKELNLESMLPSNWEPLTHSGDYLEHHGILGMKWGHRKADSRNANYSDQQYKRDKQIYGRRGANKINKSMNKGNSISVARGDEKTRRDNVRSKSKYVRQGGKVVGAGVGVITGIGTGRLINNAARSVAGKAVLKKVLGAEGGSMAAQVLSSPFVMAATSMGAVKVANMFSGDLAVATYERAHGYNPNRK